MEGARPDLLLRGAADRAGHARRRATQVEQVLATSIARASIAERRSQFAEDEPVARTRTSCSSTSYATDGRHDHVAATCRRAERTDCALPSWRFNEALRQAACASDADVFFAGEDVGALRRRVRHDPRPAERVRRRSGWSTRRSPSRRIIGLGVGAAATGLRPIVDLMFMDFIGVCIDQIVNQAAKMKYMFGGEATAAAHDHAPWPAPACRRGAAQPEPRSLALPRARAEGRDAVEPVRRQGLLIAAVRDDNPVIVMRNKRLLGMQGDVPEELYEIPLGQARHRARRATTSRSSPLGRMVNEALAAAEQLAADGLDVEVIDPRTLQPLDIETIVDSVRKTNRVARRARGGPLRRHRRRDRGADPGGGVRLPRRAGGAHRRAVLAGAVQPGAGASITCHAAAASPPRCAASWASRSDARDSPPDRPDRQSLLGQGHPPAGRARLDFDNAEKANIVRRVMVGAVARATDFLYMPDDHGLVGGRCRTLRERPTAAPARGAWHGHAVDTDTRGGAHARGGLRRGRSPWAATAPTARWRAAGAMRR